MARGLREWLQGYTRIACLVTEVVRGLRAWLQGRHMDCLFGYGDGHCPNARMRRPCADCASVLSRVGVEDATAIA